MQVEVTCKHGSIPDALVGYTKHKSEKLLTYFARVTAIHVTYDFAGDRVRCEMLVDAEHKHNFVSHVDNGEEAQATFDQTLHKMEAQIKKYKEKIQDHRRDKPLGELAAEAEPVDEVGDDESENE